MLSHLTLPTLCMFNMSSINHISHIEKNPNSIMYVSFLSQREWLITPVFCNKKEIPTITAMVNRNNHPHIVGVQALCSCNFANITALSHVAASLRIVFPAFRFLSSFMYNG